jgi:hypothetical protein
MSIGIRVRSTDRDWCPAGPSLYRLGLRALHDRQLGCFHAECHVHHLMVDRTESHQPSDFMPRSTQPTKLRMSLPLETASFFGTAFLLVAAAAFFPVGVKGVLGDAEGGILAKKV